MNRPTMTKQHFIAIASLIHNLGERTTREALANAFANLCAQHNDAFDRERFMLACLEGKISARKGTVPR